jgi:PAS domain S-box-containing protein
MQNRFSASLDKPNGLIAHLVTIRAIYLLVLVFGCWVLLSRIFHLSINTTFPAASNMFANAALGFIVAGLGFLLLRDAFFSKWPKARWVSRLCACGLFALGASTLLERLFDLNLRIDELIVQDDSHSLTTSPGRMSAMTAFNFTLLGALLVLHPWRPRFGQPLCEVLAVSILGISGLALLGYLFSSQALYHLSPYTSMALLTALLFVLLALGELLAIHRNTRLALGYGLTLIAVALAFKMYLAVGEWLGGNLPTFVLFYPVIMLAGLLAGLGPSFFALIISALVIAIWIYEPVGFLMVAAPIHQMALLFFIVNGLLINAVLHFYRRHRQKVMAYEQNRLVEKQSQASDQRLRAFLENSAVIGWLKDEEGRYVFLSETYEQRFGVSLKQWEGKTDFELWPSEIAEEFRRNDVAVLTSDQPTEVIEHTLDPQGRQTWWLNRKFTYRDAGGQRYVGGLGVDITEHQQAQTQVKLEAERLNAVLQAQSEIASVEVDRATLLRLILNTLSVLTGAEGGSIEIIDGNEMVYEAATGLAEPFIGLRLNKADSLSGLSVAHNQVLRADDTECDARVNIDACRRIGLRSMVVVPLRYGANNFGVLKLMSSRVAAFDANAEKTLLLMAEFLGATVARQRATSALAESEARLALAASGTQMGLFEWDIATDRTQWTEQFARLLGQVSTTTTTTTTLSLKYSYRDWADRVHPDDLPRVETELNRSMAEHVPYEAEYRVIWPDGSVHWLVGRGLYFYDTEGRAERMVGFVMEITARKQAEFALRQSESRLRRFYESDLLGVIYWTTDGLITDANDKFLAMVGYTREELNAGLIDWEQMTPPEFRYVDEQALAELKAFGAVKKPFEKEYLRKDGAHLPVMLAGAMLDDRFHEGVGFVLDISERKHAEKALLEKTTRLSLAMSAAHLAAWETHIPSGHNVWDGQMAKLLGVTPEEAEARSNDWLAAVHPEDRSRVQANFIDSVTRATVFESNFRVMRPDGELRWFASRGEPICDAKGGVERIVGVVQDITERHQAEEAIRQSQQDLDRAQAVGQMGWWRMNIQQNRLTWSDENYRIFGVPIGTPLTYGHFLDAVHPDDREYVDTQWQAAIRGEPYDLEHRIRVADQDKWLREKAYLEFETTGELKGAFGISQDITDRKQAEAALLASEQRFGTLANTAPALIWYNDALGGNLYVNQSFIDYTGKTAEEVSGDGWHNIVHPDHAEAYVASYLAAVQGRTAWHERTQVRRYDGVWHWFDNYARPLFDAESRYVGHVGVSIDVNASVEAEARFRTMADTAPVLIWETDASGIVFVNGHYLDFFGVGLDSIAGMGWADFAHPEDKEAYLKAYSEAFKTRTPYAFDCRFRRADGQYRWLRNSGRPLNDHCFVGCSLDITEAKQAEETLREDDRRKNQFLATLAHELRNPLAPLSNGLHILQMQNADSTTVDRIHEMMERQVDSMVKLVDDLIDVSRITRGMIELQKERLDIAEVLLNAVETSRPLIDKKGHQFDITVSAEPIILEADKIRLAQIITNLLNNAVKYTPEPGKIWLSARREGSQAVISVRDNGVGIPAEMQLKVFDMFTQLNEATNRPQGGLGIGLTLVQNLVNLHGGSIQVNSDGANLGCEFVVSLPLAEKNFQLTAAEQAKSQPVNLGTLRILIVDDIPDVADSLALLLKQLKAEVRIENSGLAALEAIKTYKPFVVLLDIGMPDMDGYEVARQIRQLPEGNEITLIALTGWGQEEDRRKSEEAGFDHHLVKPVNLDALKELLRSSA